MAGIFESFKAYLQARHLRDEFVNPDATENLIDVPSLTVIQHLHEIEPLKPMTESGLEIKLREIREAAHKHPDNEALLIAQGIDAQYQKTDGVERQAWSNLASYMYVNALNAPGDTYQTQSATILRDVANGTSRDNSAITSLLKESFREKPSEHTEGDILLSTVNIKDIVKVIIDPQDPLKSMVETLERVTNDLSEQQKDKLMQLYQLPYAARMDVLSRLAMQDAVNVGSVASLAVGVEAMIARSEAIGAGTEGLVARLPAPTGNIPPSAGSPVTGNTLQRAYEKLQQVVPVPESAQPAYAGIGDIGTSIATKPMAMAASNSNSTSSSVSGTQNPDEIARELLGNQPRILLAKVLIEDAGNKDRIIGAGLQGGEIKFIRVSQNGESPREITPREAIDACNSRKEFEPLQSFLNNGQDASGTSYKTLYSGTLANKDIELKLQASERGLQSKNKIITEAISSEVAVPPAVTGLLAKMYPDANQVPIVRMPATLISVSGDTWYLTNLSNEPPKAIRLPMNEPPREASLMEFSADQIDRGAAKRMIEACGKDGGAALGAERYHAEHPVSEKATLAAQGMLAAARQLYPTADSVTSIASTSQTRSGNVLCWVVIPNATPEIVGISVAGAPTHVSYREARQDIKLPAKQTVLNNLINNNELATERLHIEQAAASDDKAQFNKELNLYRQQREMLLEKDGRYRWRPLDLEDQINPSDTQAVNEMLKLAKLEYALPPKERTARPSAEPVPEVRDRNLDFDPYIETSAHADILHACKAKQIVNQLPPNNTLKAVTLYNLGAPPGFIVEAAETGNFTMYLKGLDSYIRARIEYVIESKYLWNHPTPQDSARPNTIIKTSQGYPMPENPESRQSAIALYTEFADEIFLARYGKSGEQLIRIPLNSIAVCEKGSDALLVLHGKDGIRVFKAENELSEIVSPPWSFKEISPEQAVGMLDSKINMLRNVDAPILADKLDAGKTKLVDTIQQHSYEAAAQMANDGGLTQ